GDTPFKFMTLVVIILSILGMFMENNAIMLLMIPILVPSAVTLGIDPVHLGVVMCLCITVGLLTPPIGLALYVMQDIADLSFGRTVKAVTPFLITLFISLLLITYIPQITMFLPNLLLGK
ncbi:MAG TPA: ABC transporter permease, partial [Firmicutes bacterium]|nr:ABC transporter permease [Bacillota bacterium]